MRDQEIKNSHGDFCGRIAWQGSCKYAYNRHNQKLGYYDSDRKATFNNKGERIADGDVVATLIDIPQFKIGTWTPDVDKMMMGKEAMRLSSLGKRMVGGGLAGPREWPGALVLIAVLVIGGISWVLFQVLKAFVASCVQMWISFSTWTVQTWSAARAAVTHCFSQPHSTTVIVWSAAAVFCAFFILTVRRRRSKLPQGNARGQTDISQAEEIQKIAQWDLRKGRPAQSIKAISDNIRSLDISPNAADMTTAAWSLRLSMYGKQYYHYQNTETGIDEEISYDDFLNVFEKKDLEQLPDDWKIAKINPANICFGRLWRNSDGKQCAETYTIFVEFLPEVASVIGRFQREMPVPVPPSWDRGEMTEVPNQNVGVSGGSSEPVEKVSPKKKCPFCSEEMQRDDVMCESCGKFLPGDAIESWHKKPAAAWTHEEAVAWLVEKSRNSDRLGSVIGYLAETKGLHKLRKVFVPQKFSQKENLELETLACVLFGKELNAGCWEWTDVARDAFLALGDRSNAKKVEKYR